MSHLCNYSVLALFRLFEIGLNWVAPGPVAAAPRAENEPVVFVANDYGFTGSENVPAAVTTRQIVNKGKDLHHIQLI